MRSTKGSGKGIRMLRRLVVCLVVAAFAASISVMPALADLSFANAAFQRTWLRTDEPVAQLKVSRTWMWGPSPNTGALSEPYVEAPGGQRTVQYFDKSRMEDNSYRASAPWDVTNGLLAEELITGRMQFGDTLFRQFAPAQVNVAGDANDPNGPTYATFNALMGQSAVPNGALVTQTVARSGQVGDDPTTASYQVTAQDVGAPTHHTVASVFWQFMTSTGLVMQDGQLVQGPLFLNPFYATGYPLTEAYWTTVLVGGVSKPVLVQVFERRVLTYTPSNPAGWQVEAGNVGQHYYTWRYQVLGNPGPSEGGSGTTFGDGVHQVGKDIQPGIYRNSDSSQGCYWQRLSGTSDTGDDVLAYDLVTIRAIVQILPTDVAFSSEHCGTWVKDPSPITSSPTAPFQDGMYFVGTEVGPGLWQNSDSSQECYWARLSGFTGDLNDIIDNNFSSDIQ